MNGQTKIWNQAFSYDAFGNINKTSTGPGSSFTPSYSSATNQMTALSGYTYDNNGQLINDSNSPSHSYGWNVDGSMLTLDTTTLTYDALGRMVEKSAGGSYTEIVYGVRGEQFATMTGQTLQKAFIPLPASVAVYTPSGLAYYRHSDHLGSVRLETTTSKTMYSSTAYAPFAEPYASSGTQDFSFTGQNQDTLAGAQGLYDFMFRKQSSVQGRWMSPDPAGLASVNPSNPQSWNRYAYVLNNSMALIDPLGLDCIYLYDDGTSVEAVDPGSCDAGSGGYYIPGTVDPSSIGINSDLGVIWGQSDAWGGTWSLAGAEGSNQWGAWTETFNGPVSSSSLGWGGPAAAANNDSWAWAFTKALFSWDNTVQAQKDAWNKGYYSCLAHKNLPGLSAAATTHVAADVASETASHFAPQIAGTYYHFTDARFTAWGKYSKVLVPEAAGSIKLWAGRLNAAGWAYADYELAKSIGECSEVLQ